MAFSQSQIAAQMLAQLRLLDPSVSAEVGTPERKIIDTVAQSNADSQIDLVGLQSALNIDSKYGTNLDKFLAVFGFGRTGATYAEGVVTFSRNTPSQYNIVIPAQTLVQSTAADSTSSLPQDNYGNPTFFTTFAVTLAAGNTEVNAPVRSTTPGTYGNVEANSITTFSGVLPQGITGVNNPTATTQGVNQESDAEFKIRFKNTVFRNLAGTEDQYLALAISTAYSSKANVVGPTSLYREYIQVPPVDDPTAYDVNGDTVGESGGGHAGEYTTSLSTIPYAKYIYDGMPIYISDGVQDASSTFYRPEVDFRINLSAADKNAGDARRFADTGIGAQTTDLSAKNQPNFTLTNIYSGTDPTVSGIRPSDILLAEFNYLSDSSRNSPDLSILNAVDVFIDGGNDTLASTVLNRPWETEVFTDDVASKYYYENFRRVGNPEKRPMLDNAVSILYWQPVSDVPGQIVIDTNTYYEGTHYWAVEDVSQYRGTVRARGGIEWNVHLAGQAADDLDIGPYTGDTILDLDAYTAVEIDGYSYDRNIVDLQASLESARQITTDVLVHKAKQRYFKFDITAMYVQGTSQTSVNISAQSSLDQFLGSQFFGSTIQLSDILQVLHNASGVDNVRWSNDIPGSTSLIRAQECDIDGNPLMNVTVEVVDPGSASTPAKQQVFISGSPTGGTWTLNGSLTQFPYNVLSADIKKDLRTLIGNSSILVFEDARPTLDVNSPIRSFTIDFVTNGIVPLLATTSSLTGGPTVFDSDFFLRDDELASLPLQALASDTLPGLIVRPRAQNTWIRG